MFQPRYEEYPEPGLQRWTAVSRSDVKSRGAEARQQEGGAAAPLPDEDDIAAPVDGNSTNLVALAEIRPELRPVPSYRTLRRFMKASGPDKRRRVGSLAMAQTRLPWVTVARKGIPSPDV